MSNILITGGAGFIGYFLALFHAQKGDHVFIFDNFFKSQGKTDQEFESLTQQPKVKLFAVDLTKPISGVDLSAPMDIVYHLAAINGTRLFYEIPYQVAQTNLKVTLNLLDWLESKKVGRLVYASTSEVYAGGEPLGLLKIPTDETAAVVFPQPTPVRFSYGTTKFMGEFLCFHFGKTFKIPTSVVRYHNIYGPRMGQKHVIPEFIARLKSDENPFKIFGGKETRAFCFIDDAVKATHLVASTKSCEGEIVHIGNSKEEMAIDQLAKLMIDHFGKKIELEYCEGKSDSVSRRCPDAAKLKRLTGFEAKTSLKEGIAKTMDWYLKNR